MKFFINLSVKKKLVSTFFIISIFIVLIGVQGILGSAKINDASQEIYNNNLISIRNLEEIKANINDIKANMLRIVFERDRSKLDKCI
ncbi:four helix bundle sensory module for signal transduction [Clostridium saccharobutylicum]|uniref:Four helix bundle sensory module for signal transduction n=1 Tax=Clostridium saccharobutylicum TaxID=169679 RepID=A0A1S8ND55_CLOSA|nr:four helix bundle sensory module for signal transduction [Clostridium saccharobutylicum]